MDKKGQKGGLGWPVVVLIVAALFLFYPQISSMLGGSKTPTTPPTTPDAGFVCPVDTTQLGFSAEDVDAPGTAVAVNVRLWVEGLPQGVVNTSADPRTVSPGDKLQAWFGAGDATYYGSKYNGDAVVPCKGTFDIAGKLWTKDTGVTMTMFDEFENPQTGAANNQSLGIGETVEMKLRVKGNYQKYYGNPELSLDNVLTAEYSRTELDSIKVTKDGVDLKTAAVPVVEGVASTDNTEVGFAMPKIAGSANVDYVVIIKADDILNPSADVVLKIYDADYFYNSKTGKIESGYEDQDNADIGVTAEPTATIYLD